VTVARKRRPLTDPKQLFRGRRRVRALPSRPTSDEVEVTLTVPREVWKALEARAGRGREDRGRNPPGG
jgi:hypothetical protein